MAFTFPLTAAQWMDALAVEDVTFRAPPQVEMSQTGGGEYLSRRLAPTLWRGSVLMYGHRHDCGAGRETMLGILSEPGAFFLVYNKRKQFPRDDPTGSILGAATPTLTHVNAEGDIEISGLPALYWLRAGDLLSFTYGSAPVRHALHAVAVDRRATSGGVVGALTVHPPIRPGWPDGGAVRLVKAHCKAVIEPGSVTEGVYGPIAMSGLSFRWQQTLR